MGMLLRSFLVSLAAAMYLTAPLQAQSTTAPNANANANPALAPAKTNPVPLPEAGGVVTGQSLTLFGHWFHAGFTQSWNALASVDAYQLQIRERLLLRGGTEIVVFSGESVVYRTALPRNLVQVAALSEAAAEQAYQSLVDLGVQGQLFRDADLSAPGL